MQEIPHFVNGERVAGNSGRFADVFNPATGEVQGQVALASKSEVDAAIADAAETKIAKAGVRCVACTRPKLRKKTPSRPMANVIRGAISMLELIAPNVLHMITTDIARCPVGPASLSNICSAA